MLRVGLLAVLVAVTVACGPVKPAYWPTFGDYVGVVSTRYKGSIHLGIMELGSLDSAIVYAASECVAGRELSREGFRAFLSQSYPDLPLLPNDTARATDVIGQMLALSRTGARLDCLRPYLYPENSAEVVLALDLATCCGTYTSPYFGKIMWDFQERKAYAWLGSNGKQGGPLLQVLVGQEVEIPAQVTVPKNTAGLPVQAWAVERESWRLRLVSKRDSYLQK